MKRILLAGAAIVALSCATVAPASAFTLGGGGGLGGGFHVGAWADTSGGSSGSGHIVSQNSSSSTSTGAQGEMGLSLDSSKGVSGVLQFDTFGMAQNANDIKVKGSGSGSSSSSSVGGDFHLGAGFHVGGGVTP